MRLCPSSFWPRPLKTPNTKGVLLATPCPVLHKALAEWHPPPTEQLAPLASTSLALSPGVAGRSTTFLCPPGAWKGYGGALGTSVLPCQLYPLQLLLKTLGSEVLPSPSPGQSTKGCPAWPEPALLRDFCPRKLPSLNTRLWAISPWVGTHWNVWHQSWKRRSGCTGSELEWEKGSAERTDSRSRFIHPVIHSFSHSLVQQP